MRAGSEVNSHTVDRPVARREFGPYRLPATVLLALTFTLAAIGWHPSAARAATKIVSVQPYDGEVLATAPKVLVVNFTDPVTLFGVTILGPDGAPVPLPGPREGLTKAVVLVDLPPLGDGVYRMAFGAVGTDGVRVESRTNFTVGVPTTTNPGGAPSSAATDPTAVATTSTVPRPTIDPATVTTFPLPVIPEPARQRNTVPTTTALPSTTAPPTTAAPATTKTTTTKATKPTAVTAAAKTTVAPTSVAVESTTTPSTTTSSTTTTTVLETTTDAPLPTGPDRQPAFPIERDARGVPIVRGSVPGVPTTSAFRLPANSTGPDLAPSTGSRRGPVLLIAAALLGLALAYCGYLLLRPRRRKRDTNDQNEPSLFGRGHH